MKLPLLPLAAAIAIGAPGLTAALAQPMIVPASAPVRVTPLCAVVGFNLTDVELACTFIDDRGRIESRPRKPARMFIRTVLATPVCPSRTAQVVDFPGQLPTPTRALAPVEHGAGRGACTS